MSVSWGRAKGSLKTLMEKATEISTAAKEELESSGITEKVVNATAKAKQFLDDKGVTENVEKASEIVGEHLDIVSGTKQLELVEERIALQAQYNDILASKLEEALNRIQILEAELLAIKRSA